MPASWERILIGDLLKRDGGEIKTGPFGTKLKAAEYTEGGVPVISVGEIGNGRIVLRQDTPRVDESVTSRMPEYLLDEGDIVFGRKGAVQRSAWVAPQQVGWFIGSDAIRLRLPATCDKRFVAFQLRTLAHQNWMIQHAAGSTMPSLNQGIIERIPIILPPTHEQVAISAVLGSLDDKIELNLRTNKSLEAIARAIYKAWFINFAPVRAKAAGMASFEGMPQRAFDQLPDHFSESDLGSIPEGWKCVPVGKLVEVVGGATPSTKNLEFWDAGTHAFCTPKDMSGLTSPLLLDTERHITQAGVDQISSGQLPVGTVLLSSRAPIGYLAIAETPVSVNQGIIAMLTGKIPNTYILLWTESNMDTIEARAGGSTFAEINKQNFRSIPALQPDEQTLAAFGEITRPLFDLIASNQRESGLLADIRDALLPRLISGSVRVKGSEGGS